MKLRRPHGLTLVEFLVTTSILAILVTASLPSYSSMLSRTRLVNAATSLESALRHARSESLAQMRPITAIFNITSATTWSAQLTDRTPCDSSVQDPHAPTACSIRSADNRIKHSITSADFPGIALRASRPSNRFDPIRGTAAGSNGTLTLSNADGREIRVIVANSGRIRSCSPKGSGYIVTYPACS